MLHLIACSIFNIEIALEHNIPEFTLSLSLFQIKLFQIIN